MKRILVVGGAGYIGSHTCKRLAQAGFTPVTYDSLVTGHRHAVKWGPLVVGDILDAASLDEAFRTHRPDAVMHFAAFAYVGESVTDPAKYYLNNVAGTLSLLEAMRRAGVKSIVFSSTCATYGVPAELPITEDCPQAPINPYGRTKLMIEHVLADYAGAYGLAYAALRYFNACGADPDGEIGEWHDPETHLVPRALMAAAGTIPHLEIFGDDYPTPDGTCIRDYIHVSDLAEAHVLALSYIETHKSSIAVNLGTGSGLSIMEVLDGINRAIGRKVPTVLKPRRPGDPPSLYADAQKAGRQLGFKPRHSDIETIVRTAWPFFETGSKSRSSVKSETGNVGMTDKDDVPIACPKCRHSLGTLRSLLPSCPSCNFTTDTLAGVRVLREKKPGEKLDLLSESGTLPRMNTANLPIPFVREALSSGKMVLQLGSGTDECNLPNLVKTDAYIYSSGLDACVDVHALPFEDNTFDYCYSLAVFEHIHSPWIAAEEIYRVLKPGGRVYTLSAFTQHVHGYPSHYFNMTDMGLRRIFDRFTEVTCEPSPYSSLDQIAYILLDLREMSFALQDKTFASDKKRLEKAIMEIVEVLPRMSRSLLSCPGARDGWGKIAPAFDCYARKPG
jgi:UDP-arabinose 4-epimerase